MFVMFVMIEFVVYSHTDMYTEVWETVLKIRKNILGLKKMFRDQNNVKTLLPDYRSSFS